MYVLALNGSPHKQGNTAHLLELVLKAVEEEGVEVRTLHVMDALKGQRPYCIACSSPLPGGLPRGIARTAQGG